MRKWTKVLAIVLGVVILGSIAGTSIVAFAADPQPTPTTAPQDIFLSKLAAKLNVTVDKLKSAITQAQTDTINQLAAEGQISAAQKDWMLERAQQGPGTWGGYGPNMMGPGFGPGMRGSGRGPFNGTPPWSQASPTPAK